MTGTPLDRLLPHLPDARPLVALERGRTGVTTVEQVAAMSDAALLDLRHIGPKHLAELRTAVQAVLNEPPAPHVAQRGSDVEAWIKRWRDSIPTTDEIFRAGWLTVDSLLDDYRLHADCGTPLSEDVQGPHPEGN